MPAAAVIPAPIAYIKVVAVKKLVVGFLLKMTGPLSERVCSLISAYSWDVQLRFIARCTTCVLYFEEIRVFTASCSFGYISME